MHSELPLPGARSKTWATEGDDRKVMSFEVTPGFEYYFFCELGKDTQII